VVMRPFRYASDGSKYGTVKITNMRALGTAVSHRNRCMRPALADFDV